MHIPSFHCVATVSSQGKCHEYRDSRREEENAALLKMKEEQRKKVQNKGSETDGLNVRASPPLLLLRNTTAGLCQEKELTLPHICY